MFCNILLHHLQVQTNGTRLKVSKHFQHLAKMREILLKITEMLLTLQV